MTLNQLVTLSSQELDLLVLLVDNQNNLVKNIGSVNLEELKVKLSLIKPDDDSDDSEVPGSLNYQFKSVMLEFRYEHRLNALRRIRELTGLGLYDAKQLIDTKLEGVSACNPSRHPSGSLQVQIRVDGVPVENLRQRTNIREVTVRVID